MKTLNRNGEEPHMIGVDVKHYERPPTMLGYFGRNRAWASPLAVAVLALAAPMLLAMIDHPWSTTAPNVVANIARVIAGISLVGAGIGASITSTISARFLCALAAFGVMTFVLYSIQRLMF